MTMKIHKMCFIGPAIVGDFIILQRDLDHKYGEHILSQHVWEAMHTTASYLQESMEKSMN